MILFTYHKDHFDCNGSAILYTYVVGLLVVLGLIILSICAVVYVSAQGKFMIFFLIVLKAFTISAHVFTSFLN